MARKRSCGRGRRRRLVLCRDTVSSRSLPGHDCLAEDKPQNTSSCRLPCNSPRRHHYRYKWRRGPWSRVKYPKRKRKLYRPDNVNAVVDNGNKIDKSDNGINYDHINKRPSNRRSRHRSRSNKHKHRMANGFKPHISVEKLDDKFSGRRLHADRVKMIRDKVNQRKRRRRIQSKNSLSSLPGVSPPISQNLNSIYRTSNTFNKYFIPPLPNIDNHLTEKSFISNKFNSVEKKGNPLISDLNHSFQRDQFSPSFPIPHLHQRFLNQLHERHHLLSPTSYPSDAPNVPNGASILRSPNLNLIPSSPSLFPRPSSLHLTRPFNHLRHPSYWYIFFLHLWFNHVIFSLL